jgi:Mrp family chromosome partitioning ATPase
VVVEQGSEGNEQSEGGSRPSLQAGAVHLLAVDPRSERPPMLDAVAFPRGMEALKRAGYEYVIIDTPAVLGALDMQIIGDTVDGVIFTSIAKRSKRTALRQAIEKIKPAPVLGVIVLEG